MTADISSFVFKGSDRESVGDFISFSSRDDVDFVIVADGHSGRVGSAGFAERMVRHVQECFDSCTIEVLRSNGIKEEVFGWIDEGRRSNRKEFPAAAASFLIFIKFDRVALIVRAGDCCMGRVNSLGEISWITGIHSYVCLGKNLSIKEISRIAGRSLLTNSLKARKSCSPEWVVAPVVNDGCLVFATDGFWGELSERKQIKMVEILKRGEDVPLGMLSKQADDLSLIVYMYGENN